MEIEYNEAKNERNIEVRGISFELATEFDFGSALITEDNRKNYGEQRYQAIGLIGKRLHVIVLPLARRYFGSSVCVRLTNVRYANMKKRVNPELTDENNPEWTDEIFRRATSLNGSSLPEPFKAAARRGRPLKANPKVSTTIRFDADIIETFKAGGAGWQSRMNIALRDWLKTHSTT